MNNEKKLKIENMSPLDAFMYFNGYFNYKINETFYSSTIRELGVNLQGDLSKELKKELESLGFKFKLDDNWLKSELGCVEITLTF